MKLVDFTQYFNDNTASKVSVSDGILKITATERSVDPSVIWKFGEMGFASDTSELQAIVFKVRAHHFNFCEIFYTCGEITGARSNYSVGDIYSGKGDWEYLFFDLKAKKDRWYGKINDEFRVDWSNFCLEGDTFEIGEVLLFGDIKEAEAFAEDKSKKFFPETMREPSVPEKLDEKGYYVCLYERRLKSVEKNILKKCDDLGEAVKICDENKVYGYRVADENGIIKYIPYTLLQSNILREGKWVTDYVRENEFIYGDAPANPGIDHRAKKVSCDRLVCWVLYRLGFIHQPVVQGVVVSAFPDWCKDQGFTLLTDIEALEPGDIMLVRPHPSGFPQHAFLFAGYCEKPEEDPNFPAVVANPDVPAGPEVKEMYSFRYDCGSNARIQSVQPSQERLFKDAYTPVALFRPVVTKENNIFWDYYGEQC